MSRGAVLLTGATGLVGDALAERLRADGWRVVGVGLDAGGPDDVVADLADDADLARVERLVGEVPELRAVVTNAGVTGPRRRPQDVTVADWDAAQAINVRPVLALSLAAARRWIAAGEAGAVVTVSSPGATRAHLHRAVYDATKGAVEALTRALAVDLGEHGIRVNAVVPAAVGGDHPDLPLGRGAAPEDVAAAVAFLVSDEARSTTGHCLAVDGGLLAQARSRGVAMRADR
ncbi:SDR family NAD(P)-dependent oxidoreductase [Jiangella sp. DSM 45060]|uniref:SDR family NAD(P)-dependent oxidoreductase n=1 Tax=Jiangella sp. DSM 45060 TaxID=1798224 RepID=UPI00087B1A84|nr:SDR family oxidoreductase [Jiangella sp. DSM 45060]SDS46028.1 3-oxoacyl-[acyl-carrier protein] reductase [Jiangella sp. DSM 45060]